MKREVSHNVMSDWDIILLNKLKLRRLVVDLYSRYFDDQSEVFLPVRPGWLYKYSKNIMEFDHELAQTDKDGPMVRTTVF